MKIRHAVYGSGAAFSLLVAGIIGWHACQTVAYVQDLQRKAEVCDRMQCERAADMAQDLEKFDLPLTKGKTANVQNSPTPK